jgi:hypothetical protein
MSGVEATDAIAILAIFLGGIVIGVVVMVSVAVRREDRRLSLGRAAPDVATRGARMLIGFGSGGGRVWER